MRKWEQFSDRQLIYFHKVLNAAAIVDPDVNILELRAEVRDERAFRAERAGPPKSTEVIWDKVVGK